MIRHKIVTLFSVLSFCVIASSQIVSADEQRIANLEQRVEALENYAESFQPTLIEVSNALQESIREYTVGLEQSLTDYSQELQQSLDNRINDVDERIILLTPISRAYKKVMTNSGAFFVSVDKMRPIKDGYRLTLNIGNPHYADYKGIILKLIWGQRWDPDSAQSQEDWRQGLMGLEYNFEGTLKRGEWNSVDVDLVPAFDEELTHIEFEMAVESIELQFK